MHTVWVVHIVININMNKNIKDPLQILQIWFSASFPVGSYAYSHGLEALIDDKLIKILTSLNINVEIHSINYKTLIRSFIDLYLIRNEWIGKWIGK